MAPKADENKPAMQDWQTVAAAEGENVPAPHERQGEVMPKPDEYVPAVQLPAHVVAADEEEYKPATQDWHTVAATDGENVPAPHEMQGEVIPKPDE